MRKRGSQLYPAIVRLAVQATGQMSVGRLIF
jgi:hypothetical protein